MKISDRFRKSAQKNIRRFSVDTCSIYSNTSTYDPTSGTVSNVENSYINYVPYVTDDDITKYAKGNRNFAMANKVIIVAGLDLGNREHLAKVGNKITVDGADWKIVVRSSDMYNAAIIMGVTQI
jgi:hypothetical protein